jgi:ribosomal protein S18 acetylase RimI-like enzyme
LNTGSEGAFECQSFFLLDITVQYIGRANQDDASTGALMIRKLTPTDADAYVRLRGEALTRAPFAFAASPADDRALSVAFLGDALASPTQAIFGAFVPGLVGVAGIYRELAQKTSHKAHLWGVYVGEEHRGRRLGRALVEAALGFARTLEGVSQVQLAVAEPATAARALYAEFGFQTWGLEPDALRVGRERIAEEHMVLMLARGIA